jgi:small-conductance mechanosensitive channel
MSTFDHQINDSPKPPYRNTAITYGALTGLVSIVIGLLSYLAGFSDPSKQQGAMGWINMLISYGVMIGGLVLAVRKHRDQELGGYITFGRAFGVGFLTMLVLGLISAVWTYVFFNFIATDMLELVKQSSIDRMVEKQGMSVDQAEAAMNNPVTKSMMNPAAFTGFAFVGILFIGAIFALIVAAIMRKSPPEATA